MMISFTQIKYDNYKYTLREIYINTEHIVAMTKYIPDSPMLNEQNKPHGLDERIEFTKMFVNKGRESLEVVVIGSPEVIERKLFTSQKQLLKG